MIKLLTKLKLFLNLYRADVPLIVFMGTLAGRFLTTNITTIHFVQAFFLAAFPYNFVYTLNAITDLPEDSINKPWRPLPSGKLTNKEAFYWLAFLTVVSASIIPILFIGSEIFLAYLIMFLGMSYSLPPFIFKKRPFLAPMITGWGVVHPFILTGKTAISHITISLLFHAFAVTFLKDISDLEGDKKAGRNIITEKISISQLVGISTVLNICSLIGFLSSNYKLASILPFVSIITISYRFILRRAIFEKTVYKYTVWTTATTSFLVAIIYII